MKVCVDCKGEIVTGPINELKVTEYSKGGEKIVIEIRCEDCAVRQAFMWWEEEWGPFPHPIPTAPGRA